MEKGNFKENVLCEVRKIPKGFVASYGRIALLAGNPRGAREVGWILSRNGNDGITPWWRVINSKGYISIKNPEIAASEQKQLLEIEEVGVSEDFSLKEPIPWY